MIVFNLPHDFPILQDQLVDALKTVIDPELYVNIVDLGLVYAISADNDHQRICIDMTLSSKFCPMGESIINATKNCMERMFTDFKTEIHIVWEPVWSYKCITAEGLKKLGGR